MTQPSQPPSPHDAAPPPQSGAGGTWSSRGPILAAVGCGLLILVLVLALIGFFGVRAWMGSDEGGEQTSSAEQESSAPGEATEAEETTEEGTSPEETTEAEPTEEEAASGEANAVPKGTVVTLEELDRYEGSLDLAVGDVNWEATEWVNEQNGANPQPDEGSTYIMVQAEVTYHGPDEFSSYAFVPVDYVAPDGTPYEEAGVVTPDTLSSLALQDGESGTLHWVFMVPADVSEGGHFVLADALPQDEALVEGQWIEAA